MLTCAKRELTHQSGEMASDRTPPTGLVSANKVAELLHAMSVRARAVRWAPWLAWVLAGVAPILMYHRVYLKPAGYEAHFFGDTTGAYWPDLTYFVRTLAQGELPLWNPNERGGFPFAFDPQPGVLYPLNWLLAAVALAIGHTPYLLLEFKIAIHLSLATLGWFAWLRRYYSPTAALVGAIANGLGLYTIQNAHFGLIWPIAWVPWALLAIELWLNSQRVLPALAWGAGIGAVMAAGSPPGALYGAFAIAGFGLPLTLLKLARITKAERLALLRSGALGALTALLLSLPVLLGTYLLTQQSILEKRDYAYFSSAPLWISDLFSVICPRRHDLSMYAGVTVVTLAVIGICSKPRHMLAVVAALVGSFGLVMALGDQTPLARWVYAVFPPVRYFRLIFRYLYLLQVGLGILAAVGVDAFLTTKRSGTWVRALYTVLSAATAAYLWRAVSAKVRLGDVSTDDLLRTLHWLVVLWIVMLASWFLRARVLRTIMLGGVVLIDLASGVPNSGTLRSGAFTIPHQVSTSTLEKIQSGTRMYRVWDEFALGYRSGSRLGVRDLRGYMDPLRLASYETMAAALWHAPALLQRWGVRWVLPAPHPYVGTGHNRVDVRKLTSARRLEEHVLELPAPRAPAVFTTRVESPRNEESLWATLQRDPLGAPVQLPPPSELAAAGAIPAGPTTPPSTVERPATVLVRGVNSLVFSVDAPTDGWLVVNEAYFPGWVARVDHIDAPIYRVDGWVRGLRVSRGSHRIELVFRPIRWIVTALLATLIWIALAVMALLATRQRYRRR